MPRAKTVQGTHLPGRTARLLQRAILERRYGMPRGALRDVDLRDIGFAAPGRVHAHVPSPWGVLRRILPRREVTHQDVFIDLGCGMGPVLVEAAARYDFRRAIGIDIVPQFTQVAEETIASGRTHLRCRDIEVVTGDVTQYRLPDEVTVVFMYDPFRGPVFEAAIAEIVGSVDRKPRRLRLIYYNPVEGGRLERTGRAQLVRYGRRRSRPWETDPELVMYEIEPAGAANGRGRRPPSPRRAPTAAWLERRGANGTPRLPSRESGEPTIQVASRDSSARSELVITASADELAGMRAWFEQRHHLRVPKFVDDEPLRRLQRYIGEAEFSPPAHPTVSTDVHMDEGRAPQLLLLLANDERLFELVRSITGCKRIGRFDGQLYRKPPGREHEDAWHGEIFGHGMIAMGIDLSERTYRGGTLEIRDRFSHEVLERVDSEPGDALLLRLSPSLQHRITAVEGDSARTVYAGRFMRYILEADSGRAPKPTAVS